MDWVTLRSRGKELVRKYRYVLLVVLAGLFLMALPDGKNTKAAPEPAAAETEPDGVAHIVKKGETLSVIARKYKMNWRSLQKFNKMNDRDVARLKIGQKIMIPKK